MSNFSLELGKIEFEIKGERIEFSTMPEDLLKGTPPALVRTPYTQGVIKIDNIKISGNMTPAGEQALIEFLKRINS